MRTTTSFTRSVVIGAFALVPGLMMGGAAIAQESTPIATPGGPSEGYPVAVHQGSCDSLTEEPAFDLGNAVGFGVQDGGDVETIGTAEPLPLLLQASGTVDSSLGDLGEQGHAVAVHASPDDFATIVACGNIAGVNDEGKLAISLSPVGGSSVVGVAIFDEDNAGVLGLGDNQVNATVYIFDTQNAGAATPES